MKKKIYLTPEEQEVFRVLSSMQRVESGTVREIFPEKSPHQVNRVLSRLSGKGYLHRVKKGVYLVSPQPSDTGEIRDPYALALALYQGYIGFSSALRIYDLLEYEPFTIFVVTKNTSKEETIGQYLFKAVAMGDRCTGMTWHKGAYVSLLSKTFFDCFYKPQYAGGYAIITRAIYERQPDWNEFCEWFVHESASLCQKTGYILDMLGTRTGIVPEEVTTFFRSRIRNNTRLTGEGTGHSRYIREWKVLDTLGEDHILSWWSHGRS